MAILAQNAVRCGRARTHARPGALWPCLVLPIALLLLTGCAADSFKFTPPWKQPPPPKEGESVVLNNGALERDRTLDAEGARDLDEARSLFQAKDYAKAQPLFHKLQTDKKVPAKVAEEALFGEAESQRLQKNYREAEGNYKALLERFRNSEYVDRCNQGLFEMADYWLQPTRKKMDAFHEQLEGKRTLVLPAAYFHFTNDKPLLDMEGHAVTVLDTIRLNDINGPLGEKALFYLGTLKFYYQEYREADFYFSQLYQQYPNSQWASKAVKQSVICKQLCTGGTVYDCRTIEESKKLLHTAQNAYPEVAKQEEWVNGQLLSIHMQQADRDWKIAEFYKRTGHPGSAYFYYELVKRRYGSTAYAEKAQDRMNELRTKLGSEGGAAVEAPANGARLDPPPERPPQPAGPTPQGPELGPPPRTLPSGLAPPGTPNP